MVYYILVIHGFDCCSFGSNFIFHPVPGIKVINWEFLTAAPRRGMTEGIFPAIVGTFTWY